MCFVNKNAIKKYQTKLLNHNRKNTNCFCNNSKKNKNKKYKKTKNGKLRSCVEKNIQ